MICIRYLKCHSRTIQGINRLAIEHSRTFSSLRSYSWKHERRKVGFTCVRDERRLFSGDEFFRKLSENKVVGLVSEGLLEFHDMTGLPWWATISVATLGLRLLVSFPVGVHQAIITAKLENLTLLIMPESADRIKSHIKRTAAQFDWNEKKTSMEYKIAMRKEWHRLVVEDNCHPAKATLPLWVQLPVWLVLSTAIRNLILMLPPDRPGGAETRQQMMSGGCLWFPDLTIPDSTLVLPLVVGLVNLSNVELAGLMRMTKRTRTQQVVTNVFRLLALAFIPVGSYVPSGVVLYWSVSSLLGLVQNLVLLSPRVRTTLKVPETPSSVDQPYALLAAQLSSKFKSPL